MITMNWLINQSFALVGLIFLVISFQQKTTYKILLFRNFATLSIFIGLCFLGNISAIIMCGAGVIRNLITLIIAKKNITNKNVKLIWSIFIILLIIILNIIYWSNYLNILSIVVGICNVVTFMQSSAKKMRYYSVVSEIISIIYFGLLLSPVNIVIECTGLISAIIGIIRLDKKNYEKS